MRGLKKTQKSSENDQLELFFFRAFFFLISPEKTVKRKVNTKGRLHDKSLKITLSLNYPKTSRNLNLLKG